MNGRRWALVSLFVGVATMVAMWLAISGAGPNTRPDAGASGPPTLSRAKAIERDIDPSTVMRDVAINQKKLVVRPLNAQPDEAFGAATRGPQGVEAQTETDPSIYTLDEPGVRAAVGERQADLEACYETALFHTPGLEGRMTLALRIEPAADAPFATVKSVDAESKLDATVFEGCVATVFEELRFAATEPTTIRYPVVFSE